MTGADFTGVDIDLLADYVGGALDGSADEDRVAALIAGDPAWREAYALLSDGMAAVGDELHAWGAEPEPMPEDVIARLEAALADAGGGTDVEAPAFPGVRSNVVDLESRRARSSRRRMRWGASFAAAAAAVALAGVGIAYLGTSQSSSDSATSSAAGLPEANMPASVPQGGSVRSSNEDYDVASLSASTAADSDKNAIKSAPSAPRSPRKEAPSPGDGVMSGSLADELARLRAPDALKACLEAIGAGNGAGSITVRTVDYARFEGAPALVVQFTAGTAVWNWVSGPRCGLPGVGADTIYSVQVG